MVDLLLMTSFLIFFLGTNVSGLKPESSSSPSNSLDCDKEINKYKLLSKDLSDVKVQNMQRTLHRQENKKPYS